MRPITPELFEQIIDLIEHKINLRARYGYLRSRNTEAKKEAIMDALFGEFHDEMPFEDENPFSNPDYARGFQEGYRQGYDEGYNGPRRTI